MQTYPKTRTIPFVVFQESFPGIAPRTYLVPASRERFSSLCGICELFGRLFSSYKNLPKAFIKIEFLEDSLSDDAKEFMNFYEYGYPKMLTTLLKDSVIALVDKLIDQSWRGSGDDETQHISLQVFRVGDHPGNIPGIYTETSTGNSIEDDIRWWSASATPPDNIIAHVFLEVFTGSLLPEARVAFDDEAEGHPNAIESLLDCGNLPVFRI